MELLLIKKEWCVSVTMGAIKLGNSPMKESCFWLSFKLVIMRQLVIHLVYTACVSTAMSDMQNSVVAAKSASILVVYTVHNQNLT